MIQRSEILSKLESMVPAQRVLKEREDLVPYSFDGTASLKSLPVAVVMVESEEEISLVLRFASEEGIPVVTRGSGTGLSGGSVPVTGGIVLCLAKMNRVLGIDARNLTASAQAGATTLSISEAAEKLGLFYPPDPSSMKISTIGGNVAENSGGLRGLKYGVTRDYVMGLRVVLADGQTIFTGNRCVKDVAGYHLRDLFIGSEGTLGVVTEVLLKLVPKPAARKTMLALFNEMEAAAGTVSAIIEAKIIPCTLEFLDNVTINCVEDFAGVGLPREAGAVLLIETDGHPAAVADEALALENLCLKGGATEVRVASSDEEAARLATARRSAFSALARIAPTTILEDATVPRSELATMVRRVNEIAKKYELRIGTFGHMGDGNLHPTIVTDERNTEEMKRVHEAMREIFEEAIALGGTITGEHGVGLAKKPFLEKQIGLAALDAMRSIKRALDPKGILNPGKIFDIPEAHPDGSTDTEVKA